MANGLFGEIANIVGFGVGRRKLAEQDVVDKTAAVEAGIEAIPTYGTSPYAEQMLAKSQEAAENLRGLSGLSKEATDIARARASMSEAPGSALAREDIKQASATAAQRILESGGGVGAMGAIADVARGERASLRDLAASNMAYRDKASQDLQSALTGQAAQQAGLEAQALGAEQAGLGFMTSEGQRVFESQLNKALTGTQYDIIEASNAQQALQNMLNRRAQMGSSALGAIGNIAPSAFGLM